MTEKTVSIFDEWLAFADCRISPQADAIGQLAEQIRARFGAGKHARATFCEEYGDYNRLELVIGCGGDEKRFDLDDFERSDYFDWLDEPRRRAEAAKLRAVEKEVARLRAEVGERAQIDSIVGALDAVEAEGYSCDHDWHDKVMNRLGVKNK
ncbi:hypothetical protein ACFRAQ_36195 [Nocardia sp. NPDC056611]|uniref:hypothetical protein n=1 Tax=Nocardia sp. NPDC056611 TaxID=3345877 RepID=UPI003672F93C